MEPQTRKRLQLVLVVFLALAAIRIALIYRSRHDPGPSQQQSSSISADHYVVPRKLRAYDLNSAREITRQPVWVKEGYKYTYYPYDPARKQANFDEEGGTLGPIEKVQIKGLVQQQAPAEDPQVFTGSQGQEIKVRRGPSQLVLAVFEKDGKSFVVPIGRLRGKDYSIYADEIFYIQDPRELYKHWPAEVWQAIEKHEVKPGMNEIQATFAVGMGQPQLVNEDASAKTVRYPNNGSSLVVVYRDGVAETVKPSS
ncbi:MAG: hypothetical protein L0Z53_08295 [Acidobacteriales bacterium]|nr:hypothetical protein [Terriglobales bacterium]